MLPREPTWQRDSNNEILVQQSGDPAQQLYPDFCPLFLEADGLLRVVAQPWMKGLGNSLDLVQGVVRRTIPRRNERLFWIPSVGLMRVSSCSILRTPS